MNSAGTNGRAAIAIAVLALGVRLAWIAASGSNGLIADAGWYHARAASVAGGHGYAIDGTPTAYFPPGYPLFLAALYTITGPLALVGKLANAVLGAATALLVYVLADRVGGRRVAWIAALLFALHPNQVFSSSVLMSETLLAFVLTALFCVVTAPGAATARSRFAAGLLLGAACLVKPAAIVVPVALVAWEAWGRRRPPTELVRGFAILLAGCALVLAPWAMRNRAVMHHGVLISTNGGVNFWMAQASGGYLEAPPEMSAGWGRTNATPELEVRAEHLAYREGMALLRRAPLTPLTSMPKKLVRLFYADIDGLLANSGLPPVNGPRDIPAVVALLPVPAPAAAKLALYLWAQVFYLGVLLFAGIGAVKALRDLRGPAALLLLVLAGWVAFHTVVFFPLGRYRLPVMPILMVFAACALAPLGRRSAPAGAAS